MAEPVTNPDAVNRDAARHGEPGRIAVLPVLVANQIAAGEVVERPASVVKELVENSLDAGARRIVIELEQGGIELVRVTDDGRGIVDDDLPLALAAHATSKIRTTTDLDHVATLGFRGEALASIASVARVSVRSRAAGRREAAIVESEPDGAARVKPASGPPGTCVTVRTLFFNTPARRKFLRTPATEHDRCVDAVKDLALAHPGTSFALVADGRTVMDLPPTDSPRERVLAVLGEELRGEMVEVKLDAFDDARGVSLWGLAGKPSIARATSKAQRVFVNGRAVRDRTIAHAVMEAYRGLIVPGRYPTLVLMLEMSPEGVDVNVHPAKAEVRFRDTSMVHSAVLRALREGLARADLTPRAMELRPMNGVGAAGVEALPGSGLTLEFGAGALVEPSARAAEVPGQGATAAWPEASGNGDGEALRRFVEKLRSPSAVRYQVMKDALTPQGESPAEEEARSGATAAERQAEEDASGGVPRRVLQVHQSYLVTQDEQGVVIVDQHALHERVMFEYLAARVLRDGGVLESQRLLTPEVVHAAPAQVELLSGLDGLLKRLGIEAEPLGPASVAVHAFPTFLFERGVGAQEFVGELLAKAEADALGSRLAAEEALRDVLDMMACKAAVKAGDRLSEGELGELLVLRERVERSSACPHGRPTSIRLTLRELEKLFGRS